MENNCPKVSAFQFYYLTRCLANSISLSIVSIASFSSLESAHKREDHAGGKPGSRPVLTGKDAKPTFQEIPQVDMTNIFSESLEERKEVAAKVGKACREVGFFYAVNHGVSQGSIETAFGAIADYFAQPTETKLETHIHNNKHFRGYEPLLETRLDPSTRGGTSRLRNA